MFANVLKAASTFLIVQAKVGRSLSKWSTKNNLALALPVNIRPELREPTVITNTLAYYDTDLITAAKCFGVQIPGQFFRMIFFFFFLDGLNPGRFSLTHSVVAKQPYPTLILLISFLKKYSFSAPGKHILKG